MKKQRNARLEERVYAAYFGRWRSVSDVYNAVYGGLTKRNTGRISLATRALIKKGWLTTERAPGARYAKTTATLKPLYDRFADRGVRLTESDKNEIEHAVFGLTKATSLTPLYGLTDDESLDKAPFRSTMEKIDDGLAGVLAYALYLLGNRATDSKSVATAIEEVRQRMKTPPDPPRYSAKGERLPIESDWTRPPIADDKHQALFEWGRRIALATRAHVRDRLPIEQSVAYKMAAYMHGEFFAARVFRDFA